MSGESYYKYKIQKKIYELLDEMGGPVTAVEVARKFSFKTPCALRHLRQMAHNGYVTLVLDPNRGNAAHTYIIGPVPIGDAPKFLSGHSQPAIIKAIPEARQCVHWTVARQIGMVRDELIEAFFGPAKAVA